MKDKLQTILGLLIVGAIAFALIKGFYKRNFASPEFTVKKTTTISAPIKEALFWYEEDLEKLSGANLYSKLGAEDLQFIKPLYEDLKKTGLVSEQMKTMSERATQHMIELDAYRGTEPNVWELAKENGYPYIFKVMITDVVSKKLSGDIQSITYKFSLYNTETKALLWEGETVKLSGFFGGNSDNEKTFSVLHENLKKAKIIN